MEDGRILWPAKATGRPRHKKFKNELQNATTGFSTFIDCGNTNEGTESVRDILGENAFMFPKPPSLVEQLIAQATDKDSIVLDSFAGSGTTAQAVMRLNAQDGGSRKFILVEMHDDIAKSVTSRRVERTIKGYQNSKGQFIEGLGGGFQFCNLSSEPLFQAEGPINEKVTFDQLSEFVWFMETGTGLNQSNLTSDKKHSTPYLGQYKDRAVFLLYNGILKDKTDIGGNVLNGRTLQLLEEALPDFGGPKIVYGARSRFDKTKLAKLGITFHQLPYELAVKTWF